jgi:hypothetical protein
MSPWWAGTIEIFYWAEIWYLSTGSNSNPTLFTQGNWAACNACIEQTADFSNRHSVPFHFPTKSVSHCIIGTG